MDARLYVGNLPEDASSEALRRRFAQHGAVRDVHMAVERSSGRSRGYAFVTMASSDEARVAMDRLDGTMFEHRALRVNEAGADRDPSAPRARQKERGVYITLQFRERHNMTYELACGDVKLTIKMFPVDRAEEAWLVEVSVNAPPQGTPAVATSGAHPTRAAALDEVARSWAGQGPATHAIDWTGVMDAMTAVRAI